MTAVKAEISEKIPPRERIIAVARDLFYRHGIRAVGVEAIAEAAGTNKMTLYRHFDSKDALVAEYLRGLAAEKHDIWSAIETAHPDDPRAQLQAWLIEAAMATAADYENSPYVEEQIYSGGFVSGSDQALMGRFHDVPWEERPAIVEQMKDERLRYHGRRARRRLARRQCRRRHLLRRLHQLRRPLQRRL